ncbi:capsule biosynthesis protein [Neptunicoccus cionae]|uniref:capsule biosynthesis protein n=1 Tax=Neptunicoccus cionae TaxID=2035344 RepID=UPI000C7568DB|nr:capsule biosynthesis protein [Amylibacter cionae]PLS22163.1 capsule biosynthesis protein [Amylibacter cionae]
MPNSPKNFRILRGGSQPNGSEPSNTSAEGTDSAASQQHVQMRHQRQAAVERHHMSSDDADFDRQDNQQVVNAAGARELTAREEIEQIKKENLTGRQLRIARRLAQRNNLSPTSDLDAVRLLRRQGIDPFGRQDIANVLTPVEGADEPGPGVALPATVRKSAVSDHKPQVIDDDSREQEVRKIQRDLVKRRRKRLGILFIKLACYVFLPTLLAGYYFYKVATPMYATYTEFVIQSADAPGATGASGLFSGSPLETVTDSITVQGYLTSRDAMLRLDEDPGFRQLFQDENIDVLQRLEADATNEDAYKVYKKRVIIGFDPTEGVIKMEVVAPSPEASKAISQALIGYAEEQVDQLTARLRGDQMTGAREIYEEAEAKMEEAYDEVARLQRQTATLDTAGENALIMGQIGELESQLTAKQLELARLKANTRPNVTKVRVLEDEITLLQGKVDEKRNEVSQGIGNNDSLVNINAELNKAQSKLVVRQQLVAAALQNLESARVEASRQTRYISRGVSPVTPDKATYPRAFENTLLALIVFAGIYLMLSLTVSILREQVTT